MKKLSALLFGVVAIICITTVLTFAAAPKKVSGFSEKSATDTTAQLVWKKTKSAQGYKIYKYNSNTKKYIQIAKTTALKYNVSKLTAGKTYKFKICAYNGKTNGEMSDVLYVYTAAPKVTGLKNAAATPTTIKLTWKKSTGATGYKLYKYDSAKKKYVMIKSLMTTTATVSSLDTRSNHKFYVKAYRTGGSRIYYSENSAVLSTGTSTSKPAVASVGSITSKSAKVNFNTVKGADGYQVQISSDGKFTAPTTKSCTKSPVTFTLLKPSTEYFVRIRTYRIINDVRVYSPYSAAKSFYTAELKAVDIIQTDIEMVKGGKTKLDIKLVDSSLKVTWTSSNPFRATVSSGVVTAKRTGVVTITASVRYNGVKYSDTVNVVIKSAKAVKCYDEADKVPDFGAIYGIEGEKLEEKEMSMLAYVYMQAQFKEKNKDMDECIEDYKGILESEGFEDCSYFIELAGDMLDEIGDEIQISGLFMGGKYAVIIAKETKQGAFTVAIIDISDFIG